MSESSTKPAGYIIYDKDGRYLDFQTKFDIADGDRKAGIASEPVYRNAHSASAARIAELEAALRDVRSHLAQAAEEGWYEETATPLHEAMVAKIDAALLAKDGQP